MFAFASSKHNIHYPFFFFSFNFIMYFFFFFSHKIACIGICIPFIIHFFIQFQPLKTGFSHLDQTIEEDRNEIFFFWLFCLSYNQLFIVLFEKFHERDYTQKEKERFERGRMKQLNSFDLRDRSKYTCDLRTFTEHLSLCRNLRFQREREDRK